jgi:hypothetical protein
MRTFKSTHYRTCLLLAVSAAFTVQAQASQAADGFGDIQSQVRAVLEGARAETSANGQSASHPAAHLMDVPESIRRVLLGIHNFNADVSVVRTASSGLSSGGVSAGSNLHSDDIQTWTQRVLVGRAAS